MTNSTVQPVLEVKNLKQYFTSGFGRRKTVLKAVDDVSFTIHKGETFGLVGESGCGKTTTGRTIIRLYQPTGGEIYFNGKLISDRLSKEARQEVTRGMQMIFQDPIASLNPRMTVKEIIGEGLKINKLCKNEKEMLAMVYDILETVGLTKEHASRYPHEFSGGQRQRIGIARALITNPDLIIADEPISALDVSIQAQVLNLLNRLRKKLGLTILFIAHDLSVVKYFSDRIGVMYNGKIVELANADELYTRPLHPYTQSLLSAIPLPDPHHERNRKRIYYNPDMHDYKSERPELIEIRQGHFVYASPSEAEAYRKKISL
ncbi:ABC transporter ATP-binding protein [Paenibacillus thiaminolyticus]|uniref:ABC transporter ATP-binding protein n=1 Tax=Paenibacillus thiaminolyticus TaxID=49283 RepID=UPI003D29AAC6